MRKIVTSRCGRFESRPRVLKIPVVLLLMTVGAILLPDALLPGRNTASAQRFRFRGAAPDPGEADGTQNVPFELLYSRSGSIYRNFRYAIEKNNSERALLLAQAILDAEEDHFVSGETGPAYSLKKLAFEYIESLPPASLKNYQKRWNLDAEVQLETAKRSGDPSDYLKLLDSYYFTESGFEAIDWLATRALDLGRFRSASRLWNDAIDSPVHSRRVTPMILIKAAVANRLAGHGERAAELMQRLTATERGRRLHAKLDEYLKSQAGDDNTGRDDSPPPMQSPWQYSLAESLSVAERNLLEDWRQAQWGEEREPLCISREAVTAGDSLAVRSFNRVLFFDAGTGKLQAEFPVKPSLLEVADEYEQGRLAGRLGGRSWERFGRSEFLESFVWNTLHSQLSSDGRHVYLIEQDDSWTNGNGRARTRPGVRDRRNDDEPIPTNRIVALPVEDRGGGAPATLEPVWTVSPADDRPAGTSGAYFLAAPVNVDGALYTLAEQDEAIKLMCLDPATGRLLWSQGVMFPFSSLYEDSGRRWRGCVIADAGDLLVVTTQAGTVAGLNPVRRTLEWMYYVGESSSNPRFRYSSQFGGPSYNYLGFLDRPLVADGRVVLLPRQSGFLHCLDLETGRAEWKTERDKPVNSSDPSDGDEYLGGVYEHVLIVAGTRQTRGVSMHDGSEVWSVPHPQVSGRGVLREGQFLIPIFDGSLRRIDAASGRIQRLHLGEDSPPRNSRYLQTAGIEGDHRLEQHRAPLPQFGHLMISGTELISLGIEDIRSLNEPYARYQSLTALAAQRELTGRERLELLMLDPSGDHRERVAALEAMLADSQLSPELRRRIIDEYQSELFLLFEAHPEEVATVSHKLEDLLNTEEDRIRFAILRSQQQMQQLDADGALSSVNQLIRYDSDRLFAVPGEEGLSVSVGAWVRVIWDWAGTRAPAGTRDRFERFLQNEIQTVLARGDPGQLDRLLHVFPRIPQLDDVRLRLARARKAEARYHEAEMLLLTLAGRDDDSVRRAEATVELADIWSRFGLCERASGLLLGAEFQPRAAELPETPAALLQALRAQPGMQRAFSNFELPSVPLRQAIVESHAPAYRQRLISDAYDGYVRIFPTSQECQFDLLAKRNETDTTRHVLTIVSRRKGSAVANVSIPSRGNGLAATEDSVVGHYFPFASEGQIRGISLIDTAGGQPNWTRSFLDPDLNDLLYVGQFDSEQTCFRTSQSLVMVSSRDGRVLWRRDHLDSQGSQSGNPRLSLFGDGRVIARRVGDSQYEVYNANTGQNVPLSRPLPTTGLMGSVGRFLVAISYADGRLQRPESLGAGPSVAIFDTETGQSVYRSAYWMRHCCSLVDGKLVLIDRRRILRVIDVARQEQILAIPVSQSETDSVMRLSYFSDASNHYVNIRRTDDHHNLRFAGRRQAFANPASNPFLPTVDVVGQLIAVDKQTGTRRWDRLLQSCSVLQSPNSALPFLVSLSWQVEHRPGNTRRLHLEVLSPETGETLGFTDNFVPLDQRQQIFHSRFDREAGLLELNGPMYRATVRFNTPAENALPDPGPF